GFGFGREREPATRLGGVAGEEVLRDRQHVLAPPAQWRGLDRDDVQAKEEGLAEGAGGGLLTYYPVRGGADPAVARASGPCPRPGAPRPPGGRAGAWPGSRGSPRRSRRGRACPPARARSSRRAWRQRR